MSGSASSVQSRLCLVTAETGNSSYVALVCISNRLGCFFFAQLGRMLKELIAA